jgi:lipopolysaccharide export system permease protein
MTLTVFTFVMCGAVIVRAIDLMARGVSGTVILQVFVFNLPYLLSFSIPMSVMTAALLLFSRLSYDGEITAMRASGLSLWQIVSPVVLVSILLSGACLYLNSELAPESRFARRKALRNLGVEDPIDLLDEGRFVRDFPGLTIYVGEKRGRRVDDIVVYEGEEGKGQRYVRARSGEIFADAEANQIKIELYDVHIEQYDEQDPMNPAKTKRLTAQKYPVTLDLDRILRKGAVEKRIKDKTFRELLHALKEAETLFPDLETKELRKIRVKILVAINKRCVLSLSCFSFVLLAVPLGMRSRRKESSVGIGISLLVILIFYLFVIIAESLTSHAALRPELIVWSPVVLSQLAGLHMIRRIN